MANLKKVMELLRPGKYAEQFAQEAVQKNWKPGQLTRMIEPPRVQNVDPSFALNHLKEWQEIVKKDPSPENIRRLEDIERDLVGILESAPRRQSAEEAAATQRLESFAKSNKPRVLTKEQMQEKRAKDQLYKKAAGIGGAIGVGMLASPSARADEDSQLSPEFSSSTTSKNVKDAISEAESKYGTYDLAGGFEKALEAPNKYILDPAKRKTFAALKGQEASEEEAPGFGDIYKQAMENVGKKNIGKFLKSFAAGAAEDPTGATQEAIQEADEEKMADAMANVAGFATDIAVDPTLPLTAGAGALRKVPRSFSKLRGLMK